MAPTVAEGAADVGGGHLLQVTYYYIICITVWYVWYRCETIVRRMAKHKSVLREQAQQINFKSVCQSKTLSKVF